MDGRGRDNVFCECLWRSVKCENIYLNQYDTVRQLHTGLTAYFDFYNHERPHQSLNYHTPAEELARSLARAGRRGGIPRTREGRRPDRTTAGVRD